MIEFVREINRNISTKINNIHTAFPAKIESFDPIKCTSTIVPLARAVYADGSYIDYPTIYNVPVVFPQSSGTDAVVAYPVKGGDTCLVVCCENALDRWRGEGTIDSQIKFSLSNAVAIVGMFTTPSQAIAEATNDNAIIIKKGNNKVKITDSSISLQIGQQRVEVTNNGIELNGNVTVYGGLTVHGDITASSIGVQSVTAGSCNLVE